MRALLIPLLALAACTANDTPLAERIIGRWAMDRIVRDSTDDVTAEQNPNGNRYILFNADGTFESGGDPYGRNTGRWTFDPDTNELYLESDAGEGDDSYWIVMVEGDRMHWQGTRSAFTERFTVEHARAIEP